jgi:hypothetical protein
MRCIVDGRVVGQTGVSVERGQRVDVGDVCNAGLGTTDPGGGGTMPGKPRPDKPGKGKPEA